MLRSEAVARRETGVLDGVARSMLPKRAPLVRLERPSRRAFGAPRDEGGEIPKTFGVANYFATVAVNVT